MDIPKLIPISIITRNESIFDPDMAFDYIYQEMGADRRLGIQNV